MIFITEQKKTNPFHPIAFSVQESAGHISDEAMLARYQKQIDELGREEAELVKKLDKIESKLSGVRRDRREYQAEKVWLEVVSAGGEGVVKAGDLVAGTVQDIKPYGAFVRLDDGSVGLLHVADISAAHVEDIGEVLAVGERIKVSCALSRFCVCFPALISTCN